LGVFDAATGQSELIAEIKDSIGELQPPNEIFYKDAFDSVLAHLRYTYRKGGFIQDVIVLEGIELPAGFAPDSSMIEIWTEFTEAPVPQKTQQVRGGMTDETLKFGAMRIGSGKAFALGDANARSAPISKRWLQIEGRFFLIEAVRFAAVKAELDRLPAPRQQAALRRKPGVQVATVGADRRPFPALRQARAKAGGGKIQMASLPQPNRGLVLDYDLTGSVTDFTFHADTTYYISGTVQLDGVTTFEGGCVVKYAPTNSATLQTSGEIRWNTDPYRPAVFTARDDHSTGAQVGSAALSGKYADIALFLDGAPVNPLRHLRISHASVGVACNSAFELAHAQFVKCGTAVSGSETTLGLGNVLVFDSVTVVGGSDLTISGANLTVHQCGTFHASSSSSATLTNSLFVNQTNWGSVNKTLGFCYETNVSVFQTVGAASHYLATNSPLRNIGTTNINSGLLADLRKRTTYPPIVLGGGSWFSNSLTLYPQAQRDTDTPDLGYSYEPLDYVLGGLPLTNATITLATGVAIGTYTPVHGYGLALFGGAKLLSEGTPTQPNRIVRYNTVQEQANTNWTYNSSYGSVLTAWFSTSPGPESYFRFTDWSVLAADVPHFWGNSEDTGNHVFKDCQFHGGTFYNIRPHLNVTNCLFERTWAYVDDFDQMNAHFRNCTFQGSELWLAQYGTGEWSFKDNLFDGVALYQDNNATNNYNAYTTNATRIFPNGANDVLLSVTNVAYQTGWLGRFYLPTNLTSHSVLLNAGSRTADAAALYHYTTSTNQTKELTSQVDIGFHYVAVNSSGQPIDTDGDGLPDYFEDANGNGSADSGETDWQSYNSLNGLSGTPGLEVFTPLK
jgi:hypothetical protein